MKSRVQLRRTHVKDRQARGPYLVSALGIQRQEMTRSSWIGWIARLGELHVHPETVSINEVKRSWRHLMNNFEPLCACVYIFMSLQYTYTYIHRKRKTNVISVINIQSTILKSIFHNSSMRSLWDIPRDSESGDPTHSLRMIYVFKGTLGDCGIDVMKHTLGSSGKCFAKVVDNTCAVLLIQQSSFYSLCVWQFFYCKETHTFG